MDNQRQDTNLQEPTIQKESMNNKKKLNVLSIVLIVFLIISLGGLDYIYNQLKSTQNDLQTTNNQLSDAEAEISALNAKLATARDLQRKKDILLFSNVVNEYKNANGS